MTPELHEQLIQLRQGELSDDEARALRARIGSDPQIAVAWDEVCAVLDALETLPDPVPPLHLQHRVALRLTRRRRWGWPVGIAGLAIAAAALITIAIPAPPAVRVLVEGTELVEGRAEVRAGDSLVTVDGNVRIEADPSVLTVTVYEGTAEVRVPGSSQPVVVTAGASRTFGVRPTEPSVVPLVPTPAEDVDALRAEIAVLRGQLDMLGANEVPFPTGFAPDAIRAVLAETFPDVEPQLDCEEFPCVATLLMPDIVPGAAETQAVDVIDALRPFVEPALGPEVEVTFQVMVPDDPDDRPFVVVAWYPEDLTARISTRLAARLEAAHEAISDDDE